MLEFCVFSTVEPNGVRLLFMRTCVRHAGAASGFLSRHWLSAQMLVVRSFFLCNPTCVGWGSVYRSRWAESIRLHCFDLSCRKRFVEGPRSSRMLAAGVTCTWPSTLCLFLRAHLDMVQFRSIQRGRQVRRSLWDSGSFGLVPSKTLTK
jgi:hypothetical protein